VTTRSRSEPATGRETSLTKRCEEIVRVAGRRFAEQGYVATSMREIASACDIKASSLYSHFSSKTRILLLLLEPLMSDLEAAQGRALQRGHDGLDTLRQMVREVLAASTAHPDELTILHYSWPQIREEADLVPIVAAATEIFATWRRVIEAGIAEGSIRRDVDSATAARMITGALQSVADDRRYQDRMSILDERGFEKGLHDLEAILVRGLSPDESNPSSLPLESNAQ
jgi:AcrR family transcriptional regulator